MSTARFDAVREGTTRTRDLGSVELWDRSLARSRQRRRLTELGRRARRRRKSVSLAVTAALTAVPSLLEGIAAAESGGGGGAGGTSTLGPGALQASGQRVVLQVGSQGGLVAAAQQRLNDVLPLTHISVDGIFGPLTRGAVTDFQRRNGLAPTGAIDATTWAVLFKAPVIVMGASGSGSGGGSAELTSADAAAGAGSTTVAAATASASGPAGSAARFVSTGTTPAHAARAGDAGHVSGHPGASVARAASGTPHAATDGGGGSRSADAGSAPSGNGGSGGGGQTMSVVTPNSAPPQSSTYVLSSNGVALPLPRQYLVNGSVDQGVDYSAPGGTPEYAMGAGVIIGEGISGFGPNAPILQITSGPLKGLEVYYGHAGPDLVKVGQHVHAGQQITEVGYGIVGISTGPHLEIGFYPPGPMGAGSRMLTLINSLLRGHVGGPALDASTQVCHRVHHRRVCKGVQVSTPSVANQTRDAGTSSSSYNAGSASAEPVSYTPSQEATTDTSAVAASTASDSPDASSAGTSDPIGGADGSGPSVATDASSSDSDSPGGTSSPIGPSSASGDSQRSSSTPTASIGGSTVPVQPTDVGGGPSSQTDSASAGASPSVTAPSAPTSSGHPGTSTPLSDGSSGGVDRTTSTGSDSSSAGGLSSSGASPDASGSGSTSDGPAGGSSASGSSGAGGGSTAGRGAAANK